MRLNWWIEVRERNHQRSYDMLDRWKGFLANDSGNVAVAFIASLFLILGLAALVIDMGRAYVVKRELQTAAESGALAGARALALPATGATKNWSNGATVAVNMVRQNYADAARLSDFSSTNVQVGYWNTTWTKATAPANLNGYADPSGYVPVDTVHEVPAVKVTVAKTAGGTGSNAPLSTYLASVLGVTSMNLQTSVVAMLPNPTGIGIGDAFPMAMPQDYVTNFWDQDPPVDFRITASAGDGNWTSFLVDANNVPTIRDLVDNGNPTMLTIGDNIWIEPGVKTSLYDYSAERIGQTMMIAVVNNDCETHTWTPITNFVAFKITDAQGGSGKYIQGHFVKNHVLDSATGASGSGFGTTLPPKLVQ
jgi:Flp pilus assembly protein TadG